MSVDEIQKAVASLSVEELRQVEVCIHEAYRKQGSGILYEDAYGTWTEEDQVNAAALGLAEE